MSNDYFNHTSRLSRHTLGRAENVNAVYDAIAAGFEKLPDELLINEGRVTYAVDSGTLNALVVSLPKDLPAYTDGATIYVKVAVTNSGACTINVDGLGVRKIELPSGLDPAVGDLTAGDIVGLIYDLANVRWVMFTPARSAQEAVGEANYKGLYDAATLYAIGESVSKVGSTSTFVKKSDAAAGTAPVAGDDWLEKPYPYSAVDLASQVQAEAGTDNATLMTPLRTKQAIDALAQGGIVPLEVADITTTVTAIELDLPSGYAGFKLVISDLVAAAAAPIIINFSSDGGSSFTSTGYTGTSGRGQITGPSNTGGTASYDILIADTIVGEATKVMGVGYYDTGATTSTSTTAGFRRTDTVVSDAVQISLFGGGNISSVKVRLYGLTEIPA